MDPLFLKRALAYRRCSVLADGQGKILRAARLLALGSAVPILSTDVLSVVGGFLKYPKVVDFRPVNWIPIQLCGSHMFACRGLYRCGDLLETRAKAKVDRRLLREHHLLKSRPSNIEPPQHSVEFLRLKKRVLDLLAQRAANNV